MFLLARYQSAIHVRYLSIIPACYLSIVPLTRLGWVGLHACSTCWISNFFWNDFPLHVLLRSSVGGEQSNFEPTCKWPSPIPFSSDGSNKIKPSDETGCCGTQDPLQMRNTRILHDPVYISESRTLAARFLIHFHSSPSLFSVVLS